MASPFPLIDGALGDNGGAFVVLLGLYQLHHWLHVRENCQNVQNF